MVLSFSSFCFFGHALAKEGNKDDIPPWMEYRKVGNASRVLVPRGSKLKKVGDLTLVETVGEYTARRLMEMEQQLEKITAQIDAVDKKVEGLKEEIKHLEYKPPAPAE